MLRTQSALTIYKCLEWFVSSFIRLNTTSKKDLLLNQDHSK